MYTVHKRNLSRLTSSWLIFVTTLLKLKTWPFQFAWLKILLEIQKFALEWHQDQDYGLVQWQNHLPLQKPPEEEGEAGQFRQVFSNKAKQESKSFSWRTTQFFQSRSANYSSPTGVGEFQLRLRQNVQSSILVSVSFSSHLLNASPAWSFIYLTSFPA